MDIILAEPDHSHTTSTISSIIPSTQPRDNIGNEMLGRAGFEEGDDPAGSQKE